MNPVWHFLNGVPVVGVARIGTNLAGDGTAAAPSYSFASDPDNGLYWPNSTNRLGIVAGGAEQVRVGPSTVQLATLATLDWGPNFASVDVTLSRGAADVLTTPDRFVSTGPVAGIGYGTGAGGAVTQLTNKSTGVTSNTVTGQITMNGAALAAAAEVGFTLTNSAIAATDVIIVNVASAATADTYHVGVDAVAAGSCRITLTNVSASSQSEAVVLNYAVIKGVAA